MLDTNVLVTDKYLKERIGFLLLLVGIISLAQAANLFPFGSAEYPTAFITISIGGALSLEVVSNKTLILRAIQSILLVLAIALILVF